MFIKTLQIKNFKCFDNEVKSLDFNIPDGQTLGSGLNIFVGDNNSGKRKRGQAPFLKITPE